MGATCDCLGGLRKCTSSINCRINQIKPGFFEVISALLNPGKAATSSSALHLRFVELASKASSTTSDRSVDLV